MQRSDIVFRSAADLREHAIAGQADQPAARVLHAICERYRFEIQPVPVDDTMLGGAYARLQLWCQDDIEWGGQIWVRQGLSPEETSFAIAHELGHLMLHRGEGIALHMACAQTDVDERMDIASLRSEDHRVEEYTPRARREQEANAFAAELLAPRLAVRQMFTRGPHIGASQIALHFGISQALAQRRLADAVLTASGNPTPDTAEEPPAHDAPLALLERLDPSQRAAARADGPVLVVAGPGTGKTATLIGRVAHLVLERDHQPEHVLALTFSNRAAGEMRARLSLSGLPGERMPVMTIHAFATALLREYCARVPHGPDDAPLRDDFRILDATDSFLLMEELLAELPLRYYRTLGRPTAHLRDLLADFSQARDALLSPTQYMALVDKMPLAPEPVDDERPLARGKSGREKPPAGTFTREQIERARERAAAYAVWDRVLRQRGLLDFGGLIQRAVELLEADAEVLSEVRMRYLDVLVDEFQDTNAAAARLLLLLAGERGNGLWVVGDRNQSIYRWRGASSTNLLRLFTTYPDVRVSTLDCCYRSVPEIVRMGNVVARHMADLAAAAPGVDEVPERMREALSPVALNWVREGQAGPAVMRGEHFATGAHEAEAIARDIRARRNAGSLYRDHAILCRTHKQTAELGTALDVAGIPVSQLGGFFERDEVKDAQTLLWLAAGPDMRGVLRVDRLLRTVGLASTEDVSLAATLRRFMAQHAVMPYALLNEAGLREAGITDERALAAFLSLGKVATDLHNGGTVADGLARFFLHPGGYAWQLARIADGVASSQGDEMAFAPAAARTALAALGEFVSIALRFDTRWLREDDFREQLTRAVAPAHRKVEPSVPVRPVLPDALEADAEADVSEHGTGVTTPIRGVAEQSAVSVVRCFLRYLHALREAGYVAPITAGDEDAVHLLTLHASKGLEFPVVYLPRLAAGEFPGRGGRRGDPCPPGFRESDAPGEQEAEERCLFYVGMTRARDTLVLTRAARYGAGKSEAQASPLLALLDDAPEFTEAAPLLDDDALASLALAEANGAREDDESEPVPQLPATIRQASYTLHELQQYLECSLQYRYARHYGLLDPAENAVHRYYRFLYGGRRVLREVRQGQPGASWAGAEEKLRSLWEEQGPANHPYHAFYWQHAMEVMRGEWKALERHEEAAMPLVSYSEKITARLHTCTVEVTVDHMERREESGAPVVLMRLHDGRPHAEDEKDLALLLYYLAYTQRFPDRDVRIQIGYLPGSLAQAEAREVERIDPLVFDVTDAVRKDVAIYLTFPRKRRSRLDNLDEAAAGIDAQRFMPERQNERCLMCAFNMVCPSDPFANDQMAQRANWMRRV